MVPFRLGFRKSPIVNIKNKYQITIAELSNYNLIPLVYKLVKIIKLLNEQKFALCRI